MLADFGITSLLDCWGAAGRDGSGDWKEHHYYFNNYAAAGRDKGDRSIMWIQGREGGVPVHEEKACVRSAVLFVLAVHADLKTLREGLTFVIDATNTSNSAKVGNERKMQAAWQSYPLRPQNIFILGTGPIKRFFINALIAFAALVTKSKVIARIQFADLEDVKKILPLASLPQYCGGAGGGVTDIHEWVRLRIQNFPRPQL
jgi:hypothetical protein